MIKQCVQPLARLLLVAVSVVILSACESIGKKSSLPVYNSPAFALDNWQIRGKLGIKTESDRASSSLKWTQSELDSYQINLAGPLGQGAVKMTAKPDQFTLVSRGKTYHSESPRQLLLNQLGWDLPVDHFQHWVKGVPSPFQRVDAIEYDDNGTLLSLSQDGWDLEFSRYQTYGSWTLPGKLTAKIQSLSLTLIIRDWETGH
ncbi:lipoprotein insertase outer membrane protein LolB [Sessilibacter corallicola]|uniref:Outer-membrane lipoprotein LolB n=1 Tax=Sessilibacter corallicola TaxID=2904075 RepID=A0ABQ0A3H1_9GAMM